MQKTESVPFSYDFNLIKQPIINILQGTAIGYGLHLYSHYFLKSETSVKENLLYAGSQAGCNELLQGVDSLAKKAFDKLAGSRQNYLQGAQTNATDRLRGHFWTKISQAENLQKRVDSFVAYHLGIETSTLEKMRSVLFAQILETLSSFVCRAAASETIALFGYASRSAFNPISYEALMFVTGLLQKSTI